MTINYSWIKVLDDKSELQEGRVMTAKAKTFFLIFILSIVTIIIAYSQTEDQISMNVIDSTTIHNNYESFNNVLQSFSNSNGTVDYTSIRNDPFNLNKFLTFINNVSPQNHPERFSESDAKAYWINVYNALAIKTIIDNPEVSSIKEISWGMGAFWRNKFLVGGKKITLNKIEHKILRGKYQDPRIHFAINCASNSCPPIGNRIVTGENLDKQLDNKASAFINDSLNVRIDHANKEIHLSRIFKWFKKDFTKKHDNLILYILGYRNDIDSNNESEIGSYKIVFNKYDWQLND